LRRTAVTPGEIRAYLARIRAEALEDLEPSLAPFRERIPTRNVHLAKGDPRVEIARFARAFRTDLLVIGTAARKGLMGRVLGNTAEALLPTIHCSMLVIRPGKRGRARVARE
jgi:nucleotide-binding universal stress UspA family protein